MMFKEYIIIDDALDDPYKFIELSKKICYFTKNENTLKGVSFCERKLEEIPPGSWSGFRSKPLHIIEGELFRKTTTLLFDKVFPNFVFDYRVLSFLHLLPKLNENVEEWWHKDDLDVIFASVIYLNEKPESSSGTIIKTKNGEVTVDNVFNRMVFYKANIQHRPENGFGNNIDDSRLTLTFFVRWLNLESEEHKEKISKSLIAPMA